MWALPEQILMKGWVSCVFHSEKEWTFILRSFIFSFISASVVFQHFRSRKLLSGRKKTPDFKLKLGAVLLAGVSRGDLKDKWERRFHINTGNTWRFFLTSAAGNTDERQSWHWFFGRGLQQLISWSPCHAGGERMWRRRLRWSALWQRGWSLCTRRSCCRWSNTTVSMTSTLQVWKMLTLTTSPWSWWWGSTPQERQHSSSKI